MGQPALAMAVDVPLLEEAEGNGGKLPQAEGALEWLVNFVALTEPEVLPELGLPAQWVEFMLSQHDDLQLEAQRMVYLAQLATPERLGSLARARAAAMLYDAVTPEDWYYASRALAKLPAWVLQDEDQTSLLADEGERRKAAEKAQGTSLKAQVGTGSQEPPQMNRAQRRRQEKAGKKG
jgi:hypothetical protein